MALSQAIPTSSQGVTAPQQKVIQLGPIRAANLAQIQAEEEEKRAITEAAQSAPVTTGLAGMVISDWWTARDAKRNTVETRLLQNIRARRGEYDPDKLQHIIAAGGTDVYAMLTSVKCRAAGSWLRDVLAAGGTEKPWGIRPTPIPDLPPDLVEAVIAKAIAPIQQVIMTQGDIPQEAVQEMIAGLRDQALNELREKAREKSEKMEAKMEDQLIEGGFPRALDQFIDDIVTYPSAILKGPIVRNKPTLQWVQGEGGAYVPQMQPNLVLEWERVSPFAIFPSPEAEDVNDGYLIEKHQLHRSDLRALIGVEGYDDGAIEAVLRDYGNGGLRSWLYDDTAQTEAEGKSTVNIITNPEGLIDALQYWGSVQGQKLIDWGMDAAQVPDPLEEYSCEVWVIGSYVIKATLNYDPLGRKPYYRASYEEIPGSFWGNAPPDLVRDTQQVVNAAMRALVNNMGIASGPQVQVNIDRLPEGEDVESIYPWKIWQVKSDPAGPGGTQHAVEFFQPDSRAAELIGIIEKFMSLADEWSGIPKYLTGDAPGGAGRTASGLSMLMSNAGKSLKQVVANMDSSLFQPMLERLHYWNMMYNEDPDLKGDVNIVVRGANALIAKESAQVRRNEFLATTANPIDMQIVGIEGRAEILRETAKGLDLNPDRIVPSRDMLRQKLIAQAVMAQQGGGQPGGPPQGGGGAPPKPEKPASRPSPKPPGPSKSGQELLDGRPQTDNFGPMRR